MFDGVDDHVILPSIHTLGLTDRCEVKFRVTDHVVLIKTAFLFLNTIHSVK